LKQTASIVELSKVLSALPLDALLPINIFLASGNLTKQLGYK